MNTELEDDILTRNASTTDPSVRVWRRQRRVGVITVAGAGLLGLTALALAVTEALPLSGRVEILAGVSSMAAVTGTSLVLFLLLLISRWPVLERAFGQDQLVGWHKKLAPWALYLIAIHVILIITASAIEENRAWVAGIGVILRTHPGIVPALAGLLIMVTAGITSWRRARRRMRHETWWTLHLLTYVGIVLAFFHQVVAGDTFDDGAARAFWVALYVLVLGLVLWNRLLIPVARSWRHELSVTEVVRESEDVVSVWMTGRNLDRLRLLPGQFMNFRFSHPGLSYEAHPFSVSGRVGDRLRISVKALGDASTALMEVPRGTRVTFEGPYGIMIPPQAEGSRYVLVAGGVGIGPIVSLVSGLEARGVPIDVIYRASVPEDLILADELRGHEACGTVRLHLLAGPRAIHPLDADHLASLLGDITDATVFTCGPASLNQVVEASARSLGVPASRIHSELFDL